MVQEVQKKQEKKRGHLVFTNVEGEFIEGLVKIPHVDGVSELFLTSHVSPRTLPSPNTAYVPVWELHMCKDVKAGYVFKELWDRVAEVADKFGYVCAFNPLEGSCLSEEGHPLFRFMVFRSEPGPTPETTPDTESIKPADAGALYSEESLYREVRNLTSIGSTTAVRDEVGKTMTVRDGADLVEKVSDVEVVGNPDAWRLVCKASSQKEGWMKSTKVMQVGTFHNRSGGGCLVQVTTQQGEHVAESVCYVPGADIRDFFIDE